MPVVKPDGSVRVCIDYRGLNEVTPLRGHYMPTLECMLSTLDLTSGFHQIQVAESSRALTTFGCPQGKFRFRWMPFGLKNAPAIFQGVVEDVLKECIDVAGNYIDDVLVFSESWESHLVALRRVLSCSAGAGFTVSPVLKRERTP